MKRWGFSITLICGFLLACCTAQAQLEDLWKKAQTTTQSTNLPGMALSNDKIAGGLKATKSQPRPTDGGGNGHAQTAKSNGSAAAGSGDELDARILGLEKAVGTALFRGILREYGRANQPKLIRDAAIKGKVLQMLESATRGLDRLEAVTQRLDPNTVKGCSISCKSHR